MKDNGVSSFGNQDSLIELEEPQAVADSSLRKVAFKDELIRRYTRLLGEDGFRQFEDFSNRYIRKSIRVNTLKIGVKDILSRLQPDWKLLQVPWCEEGFWIEYRHGKRFDIGNLPEHQLGYIYVQDAASMIPPVVLNPSPGDVVLDISAAPGSKTSQIAMYMNNEGVLVANDADAKRLSALGLNIQRCGVHNAVITHMEGHRLANHPAIFDKILVDAPCSGTGTIRRNFKIAEMWSPHLVKRMAAVQYQLLSTAFALLKQGGDIVYSTCTMEPEEDEGVVDRLLREYSDAKLLDIDIDIKRSPAVRSFMGMAYSEEVDKCLRIYPQDNDTEGFFVAKIHKY